MARRGNSYRRTAPKRRMFWARRANIVTLTSDNQATVQSLLAPFQNAYDADLFGFTVTRIVGSFTYWCPSSQDVSTSYNLSMGIRVDEQSEQTTGTDITDSQQLDRIPINDPHVDWMWARNNLGITDSVTTHSSTREAAENRVDLDLHSQRRLDELGQSLFLIAGLNSDPGDDVVLWYDFNVLCKRP